MSLIVALILLSVVTALTCAVPGIFLVLSHRSMLVDAMSHAVLPGIAIGAVLSGSTHSPIMVVLAASMGLLVVAGASWLERTGLVAGDANQGLVFPVLFSIGVILLSTRLSHVHIDAHTILAGNINLQALSVNRLVIGAIDWGPVTMWKELGVLVLSVLVLTFLRRVLAASTFDPNFALTAGLPVKRAEAACMCLIALTVVVCFDAVGSSLVVALMIAPPATALLVARTLRVMVAITILDAVAVAVLGFALAYRWDLATSSMMAAMSGLVFLVVFGLTQLHAGHTRRRLTPRRAR